MSRTERSISFGSIPDFRYNLKFSKKDVGNRTKKSQFIWIQNQNFYLTWLTLNENEAKIVCWFNVFLTLNNVSERSPFAYMSGQSSTHAFLYDIYSFFTKEHLKNLNMFYFLSVYPKMQKTVLFCISIITKWFSLNKATDSWWEGSLIYFFCFYEQENRL